MSNRVAIVTDSAACLPENCLRQYNTTATPLSVVWVDILLGEFYSRLSNLKTMPPTLKVTPGMLKATFSSLLESARTVLEPVEMMGCPLSQVIGTHAGPGTVALSFMSGIA